MKLPSDWAQYQVRIDGADKPISDLTVDELRFALVQSINLIESLDTHASVSVDQVAKWRRGERIR